ncbi:MAG: nucleoside triphosphate pyrophosphohydrolase [Rhodospirillales bacterium]
MSTQIDRLVEIMALLRDPEKGCPWDVEQDFASIAPHTIEEAYEVADAIEQDDMEALRDELGDLLLQVVFYAQMAGEQGIFDMEAVAGAICDKLVRRHPHVFGDMQVKTAAAQLKAWEDHKAQERKAKERKAASGGEAENGDGNDVNHSVLDGVALALPALMRANKLQKRAARVGFDWPQAADVLAKFSEETAELEHEMSAAEADKERLEDEVGDLLFTAVNMARKLDLDPEQALRRANSKFERRFRRIEGMLAEDGKSPDQVTLDEMEALWDRAKGEE